MREGTRFTRAAPYIVVGAAAGYLFYVAANIQYQARVGTLGPDFWPKLVLAFLMAVCAYEVVKIFVLGREAQVEGVLGTLVERAAESGDTGESAPAQGHPRMLLAGIALTAAYVALVQTLGFFAATVPYLLAFVRLGGYRRWGVNAAVSVVGTLLMLFFFMKVVYVSLPLGAGPFQQVTLFLMQLMGIR